MKRIITNCLLFFLICNANAQDYTLSGFVKEKGSSEFLPGVYVTVPELKIGTSANDYGFYSINLPTGSYKVYFHFTGFKPEARLVTITENLELTVYLQEESSDLNEVVVNAETIERVSSSEKISVVEIPVQTIKDIPTLMGEKDVLKTLQLLPGVQSGGEGQSGVYVRGGGPDQNLVILDDATLYNVSHLFGFFSLFNGDALKSVELTKGGFPASYGGRLSSVIDMKMREGNREKYTGEYGIGLISSRGVFEGPIPGTNNKGSFLVSARRTYIDILAQPFILAATGGDVLTGYFFQDFNAKLNYELSSKDKLYLSGYFGKDKFYLRERAAFNTDEVQLRTNLGWGNATGTMRWNHQFNDKLFSNVSLIFSRYNFGINLEEKQRGSRESEVELRFDSRIRDITQKIDFDYFYNNNHKLKFGFQNIFHRFTPNAIVIEGDDFEDFEDNNLTISTEGAFYAQDIWRISKRLKANVGLRLSYYGHEGEFFAKPEPRLSANYKIDGSTSFKVGYSLMNQYVHLLSNSGVGLPTDLWVPATRRIEPQQSVQYAAGLAKDFAKGKFAASIEGYYKDMNDIIAFQEGASFFALEVEGEFDVTDWQDLVTVGNGKSYGVEFFLQKKTGNFNGWIGYTLSKTTHQFDELNNGKEFFPRFDRRHDISIVLIYKFNDHLKLSTTWVYGTGNSITVPTANIARPDYLVDFNIPYIGVSDYFPERGNYRMQAYHRLDIGIQLSKEKKRGTRTWDWSIYNAYARANPFFVDYYDEYNPNTGETETKFESYALFPLIPSITYSFKFN